MARKSPRHYYFCFAELSKRLNAYIRAIITLLSENYCTINQCEEGVILTHTYILTCVVNSTTLTNDDVACLSKLTTEKLQTESFALRLTAVLRTTYTFFVCHTSLTVFLGYATMSSIKICERYWR